MAEFRALIIMNSLRIRPRWGTFMLLICMLTGFSARAEINGYVFAAPGGISSSGRTSATLHVGAGGEGVFRSGIGAGAEVGYLGTDSGFRYGVGVLSPNGYFHFAHRRRLDPYVTGGYTLFFRGEHLNLFNLGGGVNWWFRDRLGVKAEFRDHISAQSSNSTHYWGFRFGLVFR